MAWCRYAIFHVLFALAATALSLLCGFADSVNGDAPPLCSVPMMRGMNVLFGFLNFFLFQRLLLLVYPPPSDKQADWGGSVRHAMMALLLHLFPVQFFFYFLYYTDTVSTFFVFLCYYYALKDNMTVSGLVRHKPSAEDENGGSFLFLRWRSLQWPAARQISCGCASSPYRLKYGNMRKSSAVRAQLLVILP